MPQRTSTTRLPAALREQIDRESGQSTRQRSKQVVNRKEARKQERHEKKQRKAVFFSRPTLSGLQIEQKRPADAVPELEEGRPKKRPRTSGPSLGLSPNGPKSSVPSTISSLQGSHTTSGKQSASNASDLPTTSARKPAAKNTLRQPRKEDPEDARIAWLESKLGTVKSTSRKKKSTLFGDGLDDLLDDLDRIVPTLGRTTTGTHSEVELSQASDSSEFEGFEGFSDTEEEKTEHVPVVPLESGERMEGTMPNHVTLNKEAYKISSDAALTGATQSDLRYIPPHLRQLADDGSEKLSKLSRQIKGLLNRLTEQNIASILESIERLYRDHRRNDITSTLTDLIIDGVASHSSLLDSFVVLHASLVASLHRIIGVELAAHFVQCLIASYEHHYFALRTSNALEIADDEAKGKESLNLVVLMSELYNFQVISCVLVYDIIRTLLDRLDEFDVELLLKISRNSGQQLRQDDPSALKDIIQLVQTKMSSKEQSTISSRTRFMIETLTNLKNNKAKRTAGQDGHSESVDRMKKFLSGLSRKHHILAHEPLRITLDDLHSSEKKGKWWLVGSAWGGDPLLERAQTARATTTEGSAKHVADALEKLARKQGMNTDVRRSIFVVLMSSDDYIDACERLSQLNLSEIQQREIIRVILHCLGNEKLYNPYYTLVVQQLCKTSHSYKVTLQFCLWDFLRSLGEKSVGGVEILRNMQDDDPQVSFDVKRVSSTRLLNVARAYAWWLAKGCSSLTILKPVDFTVLRPQSLAFFRALFSQLFISTQVMSPVLAPNEEATEHLVGSRSREALEEVFIKATRVPTLTQGLLYFLTTSLRGDGGLNNGGVLETLKWAREVAEETLRTGMDVVASLT